MILGHSSNHFRIFAASLVVCPISIFAHCPFGQNHRSIFRDLAANLRSVLWVRLVQLVRDYLAILAGQNASNLLRVKPILRLGLYRYRASIVAFLSILLLSVCIIVHHALHETIPDLIDLVHLHFGL